MLLCIASGTVAELKVATLHPLMTDLAKEVGGTDVRVVQLIDAHDSPHTFSPSPRVLAKAKGATVYLASGKGMEPYLGKLRDTLGDQIKIIEVGKVVPPLKVTGKDAHHLCCPGDSHGTIDPHWWHDVSNMKKATREVARIFAEADPENATDYRKRAAKYMIRLVSLENWIKRELSRIPENRRVLATAHAAFGYFCKAYGFKSLPVKGISASHKISAGYQAEAIQAIRKHGVTAIFPERRSNPKALQLIAKETGIQVGGVLVADGAHDYEMMMRANVGAIASALTD